MRRITPIIILLLIAGAAYWYRGIWLGAPERQDVFLGYVEADNMMIAPILGGRLVAAPPKKGETVKQGDVLFALDDEAQNLALVSAEASYAVAQNNLADLQFGRRAPEIAQIQAQLTAAIANLERAQLDHDRIAKTMASGASSYASYDQANATLNVAAARKAELEAALVTARLPAREAQIAAAEANRKMAAAAVSTARLKISDMQVKTPADAVVEDRFFNIGETVAAGQPVVQLRKAGDLKLVFFVPEQMLTKATLGTPIHYACDGCTGGTAQISRIDPQPEYTPPVIYSQSAKSKLVFRAEADVNAQDKQLLPGLPLQVELAQ
jgi:HlyD family secretion protein